MYLSACRFVYNFPIPQFLPSALRRPTVHPTKLRYLILLVTTIVAFLMYLDRACLSWIITSDSFKADFELTKAQQDAIKEAFFWAYALAQVPAAWLAERFGKRPLMAIMILTWSAFTALTSFSDGFMLLLFSRLGCGLAEAGAFPVAGSLLGRWAHINRRGLASSVVSLGGRLGLVLAPLLTASIIVNSGNWRWAGWVYGFSGIAVAFLFWWVFRETPEEHPACNEAEREYLAQNRPAVKENKPSTFPWRAILTDPSIWLMCAVQFLTNFGWAFVVNTLPNYFKEAHQLNDQQNGQISTLTLSIGMFGLLAGGMLTDRCTHWLGVRAGRQIPIVFTRFLAGAMFLCCLWTSDLRFLVVLLGLMAFTTDAGLPAMWAWTQDVGGRRVASVLGWANMWGNFGAALQARVIGYVLVTYDSNHDFHEGFQLSAAAFILAGVLAIGINAAKPVQENPI